MTNREIDALVAEKVMGIELVRSAFHKNVYFDRAEGAEVKPYSTDISAAWEVVEKLRSLGFNAIFYLRKDGKNAVRFTKERHTSGTEKWRNDPFPLAICKAALRAVGVEDE